MENKSISVIVPINIALVKYWGKRDANLILPLHDSLSITIDGLYAETNILVVKVDSKLQQPTADVVTINGDDVKLAENSRFSKCFDEVRRILGKTKDPTSKGDYQFIVSSETNFPVGAGLASSAAGFAAIAYALGRLFDLDTETICRVARLGSGSACRSVYGGLVRWNSGTDPQGADCGCTVLAPADYWPSLTAVVAVVSSQTKAYGSTDAMSRSVATSPLLQYRTKYCVPDHIKSIERAFMDKNFPKFAECVMRESNQLHAICLDTYPPLLYLSEASKALIHFVHAYNKSTGSVKVAYTFDAGANCCMFLEKENLNAFLSCLCYYFPNNNEEKFIRGCPSLFNEAANRCIIEDIKPYQNAIEYVVVSTVGNGPRVVA